MRRSAATRTDHESMSEMSDLSATPRGPGWQADGHEPSVHLYLSGTDDDAADLIGAKAAGYPLALNFVPVTQWLDAAEMANCVAAVVQVDMDTPASIKRFEKLVAATETPIVVAAYNPPLAFYRALIKAGAHDVVSLPIQLAELEVALAPVRAAREAIAHGPATTSSRIVSMIKAEGGVGATALLTQLATRFAATEAKHNRRALLIDFDIQFGDAAFQLGLQPPRNLSDLIAAGSRLDRELMRSAVTPHPSGLSILAAPREIMPLDSFSNEQAIALTDLARRDYQTLFLDLPMNWTNWSLSLLARSDVVVMVAELTIPSLHRARRQLDLLASMDLGTVEIRIVVNRFQKGMFKSVTAADAERVLGRPIAYTIANDHEVMSAAIERGVPVADIRRRTPLGRDLDALEAGLAAAMGWER